MQKINFEKIGFDYIKPGNNGKNLTNRKFVSFYGASPKHVEIIWFDLAKYGSFKNAPAQKVRPVHLLMGLHFLRCYNTEEEDASFFGCDEKAFRKWSWYMIKGIAKLD